MLVIVGVRLDGTKEPGPRSRTAVAKSQKKAYSADLLPADLNVAGWSLQVSQIMTEHWYRRSS